LYGLHLALKEHHFATTLVANFGSKDFSVPAETLATR
jgi:hypothetical protein